MLKQKMHIFKEYIKLGRQLRGLDVQKLAVFKEYLRTGSKISIIKTKQIPCSRPDPGFWGVVGHPCIINHQGDEIDQKMSLLATGVLGMIKFQCPRYVSDAPCANKKCMYSADNEKYIDAEKAWHECSEKYLAVKKEYDAVRKQLFGKRR